MREWIDAGTYVPLTVAACTEEQQAAAAARFQQNQQKATSAIEQTAQPGADLITPGAAAASASHQGAKPEAAAAVSDAVQRAVEASAAKQAAQAVAQAEQGTASSATAQATAASTAQLPAQTAARADTGSTAGSAVPKSEAGGQPGALPGGATAESKGIVPRAAQAAAVQPAENAAVTDRQTASSVADPKDISTTSATGVVVFQQAEPKSEPFEEW